MPKTFFRKTQLALSWFALIATLLAVVIVVGSYLLSASQPYRGPSLLYFYLLFFAAVISKKWSTMLLIFALPLLPNLAQQAEYVFRPSVKYFVAYPGLDSIIGLFLGQVTRSVCIDRNLHTWLKPPPWPFGLALLVIAVSCCITIDRNLWQSATNFSLYGVLNNIFRFKHVLYGNSFSPFNDFLVYSGAVLLVICLLQTLSESKHIDQFVFKPVIAGLIVSASWGISQAMTGFGLREETIQYRTATLGYSAVGFQPDIHAFAGHMLVGAVGLFGYLMLSVRNDQVSDKLRESHIAVIACLASWVALILSKSRASLIFAILISILWVVIYLKIRKYDVFNKKFVSIVSILIAGVIGLSLTDKFWLVDLFEQLQQANLSSFEVLNKISVYRLEIFAGALRMFVQFPIMGIGQGNFFHLSSILEFMGSPWVTQTGGENAHNYFLQTFAEIGLVGILSFLVVFLWPMKQCIEFKKLAPACAAIIAIFLGNLYSHSLIIRENLYLLAVFVALLYAHCSNATMGVPLLSQATLTKSRDSADVTPNNITVESRYSFIGVGTMVFLIGLVYLAYQEVTTAKNKFPFVYGSDCNKPTHPHKDGWTSGRLVIPLAEGKSGVKVTIDRNQADANFHPVNVSLNILDKSGRLVNTVEYIALDADQFSIKIAVPEMVTKEFEGGNVIMQLSKCFSPSNYGLKDDSRKLGVHLKSIEQF